MKWWYIWQQTHQAMSVTTVGFSSTPQQEQHCLQAVKIQPNRVDPEKLKILKPHTMTVLHVHYLWVCAQHSPCLLPCCQKRGQLGAGYDWRIIHTTWPWLPPHQKPSWSRKRAGSELGWPVAVCWRRRSLRKGGQSSKNFSQTLKGSRQLTELTTGLQIFLSQAMSCATLNSLKEHPEQTPFRNYLDFKLPTEIILWSLPVYLCIL